MKLRGYLLILAAAALWGTIGPVARRAFVEGVAPMEVAFWRAVLAWGLFGLHAVLTRQVAVCKRDMPPIFLFAVTGVTLFYGSYQIAVKQGGAALASVLLYTAPAWVAVMSRVFFKENINKAALIALLSTIAGVVLVSSGGGGAALLSASPLAIVCGLLSGFSYSLYYIFGKYFQDRYTAPNLFFLYSAGGGPWACCRGCPSARKAAWRGFVWPRWLFFPLMAPIFATTWGCDTWSRPALPSQRLLNRSLPHWWRFSGGMKRLPCRGISAAPLILGSVMIMVADSAHRPDPVAPD